jgi:hypothetical protein
MDHVANSGAHLAAAWLAGSAGKPRRQPAVRMGPGLDARAVKTRLPRESTTLRAGGGDSKVLAPRVHSSARRQGLRTIKADDSHFGDRFGRTVVLHGDHLIVGADYATCQDASYSPGGVCASPGKGAVYVFERDLVTAPHYRWSDSDDTGSWGGFPSSSASATTCDPYGGNCVTNIGPPRRPRGSGGAARR